MTVEVAVAVAVVVAVAVAVSDVREKIQRLKILFQSFSFD
jgi:hypothetical protein